MIDNKGQMRLVVGVVLAPRVDIVVIEEIGHHSENLLDDTSCPRLIIVKCISDEGETIKVESTDDGEYVPN